MSATKTQRQIRIGGLLSVLSLLLASMNALALTISPSPSYDGNYTVTWGPTGCEETGYPYPYPPYVCYYLYENGNEVSQSSPYYASGKPDGTYNYSVVVDYSYYLETVDSANVIVGTPPPRDSIQTQWSYEYEVRAGDYQGNGRTDLLVERVWGGVEGNGVLDTVLLWQDASGGFSPVVLSPSQFSSIASSWPLSSATAVVTDLNVDGFVDVALKGVPAATGSTNDQIIFSSGVPLEPEPLGVRAVDASLRQFVGNSLDYFVNHDYFEENAGIEYFEGYVYYYYCPLAGGGSYGVLEDPYAGLFYPCYFYYEPVYGYYEDYSQFNTEAVAIWTGEDEFSAGGATLTESTQSAQEATEEVLEVEIGGWPMEEVYGSNGEHTDPDARRGLETFWAILGIGRAHAQEIETDEAPPQTGREADVIYVTARRVAGFLAKHTALEYSATTISATDSDTGPLSNGMLVSHVDLAADAPIGMMTEGTVSKQGVANPSLWTNMLLLEDNYDNNLPYHYNPSQTNNEYNSNGFVHGIVICTQASASVELDSYVGGQKPVPCSSFQ